MKNNRLKNFYAFFAIPQNKASLQCIKNIIKASLITSRYTLRDYKETFVVFWREFERKWKFFFSKFGLFFLMLRSNRFIQEKWIKVFKNFTWSILEYLDPNIYFFTFSKLLFQFVSISKTKEIKAQITFTKPQVRLWRLYLLSLNKWGFRNILWFPWTHCGKNT